jgi:hypothetical protein
LKPAGAAVQCRRDRRIQDSRKFCRPFGAGFYLRMQQRGFVSGLSPVNDLLESSARNAGAMLPRDNRHLSR